jgi:hypothetical protein
MGMSFFDFPGIGLFARCRNQHRVRFDGSETLLFAGISVVSPSRCGASDHSGRSDMRSAFCLLFVFILVFCSPVCFSSLILDNSSTADSLGVDDSISVVPPIDRLLTSKVLFRRSMESIASTTSVHLNVIDSLNSFQPPIEAFVLRSEAEVHDARGEVAEERGTHRFRHWLGTSTGGFAPYDPRRCAANGSLALWECPRTDEFERRLPSDHIRAVRALPTLNQILRNDTFQTTLKPAGIGPFNLTLTPLRAGGARTPAMRLWWRTRGRYGLE